ncbi:glycosyltransferase family 61 protein [Paracoccus caeni]|uniref:Glycosyltransferase family 61 protein n=1 Tax=Paracoccus caeni TaxID=657651 RepID=A0A934SF40_9RHOB|nr:glycosyltransferase family 61 protein [Paracoccus caeni]MBK4216219.1 glycosyltransferase family 61 protein [Paracoccus caeni]
MSEPLPAEGWSREIVVLKNAVVYPPTGLGMQQVCGVQTAEGDCLHASMWRGKVRLTMASKEPVEPLSRLPGRHMWGGLFYGHFGHFMTETMSRCWAFDRDDIESVVFIPKHEKLNGFHSYRTDYWNLLGLKAQIHIAHHPIEVEELLVPGQGFGLGLIAKGTPEYRETMRRLTERVETDEPRKIYISRTKFGGRGGIIAEMSIEENMARNGYTIMHPERMPLVDQFRYYKSATHIVGVDSSAFHIAGMMADPSKQFAFILRRDNNAYDSIADQILGMTGRPPHIINTLVANWMDKGQARSNHLSWGEIDHLALARRLQELGFIDDASTWEPPSPELVQSSVEYANNRSQGPGLVRNLIEAG